MKTCPACGHSEMDDSHFCGACGADLTSVAPDAPAAVEPPAWAAPAPLAPPASPVVAPPAAPVEVAAPPAPPAYAPPVPPAYVPPVMAPPTAAAVPGANKWMMPAVIAVIAVLVIVGGIFAYTTFFNGPMTGADYKAKAIMYLGQMENAGSETSATLQLISSEDPAERAQANAAWDAAAAQTRAAMAGIRGLRPPAEMQSIHDRLIKGIDATEKVIVVTDTLYSMLASGEINSSSSADTPAIKAFTDVASDTTIGAALSDLTAAYNELKSK